MWISRPLDKNLVSDVCTDIARDILWSWTLVSPIEAKQERYTLPIIKHSVEAFAHFQTELPGEFSSSVAIRGPVKAQFQMPNLALAAGG